MCVVKLHHLCPASDAKKAKTCAGRGEVPKDKTAGRDTKGIRARYQAHPDFEDDQIPLHMRLPRLRGFHNPNRIEFQPANVDHIAGLFPEDGTMTMEDLVAKDTVRKNQLAKALGGGDVTVTLAFTVDAWSSSTKERTEAAGSTITTCRTSSSQSLYGRHPDDAASTRSDVTGPGSPGKPGPSGSVVRGRRTAQRLLHTRGRAP